MKELINLLEANNIRYQHSVYGYNDKSIIIKKNKYQLEVYEDKEGLVSDLQKVPYTWGRMGSTTLNGVLVDLKEYLGIEIKYNQANIFDFIGEN